MNIHLEDIISGCRQGHRRAQKQLFEYMAGRLLTVSRQYTPKGLDPMDNLQDSFIKIFDRIYAFDVKKGSFESWARRIVINTALDKLNKKGIEEVILEAIDKQSKNNYSRLLIKQRACDCVYFCELYLKNGEQTSYDDIFRLGHSSDVEK